MRHVAGSTHSLLRIVAGLLFICPGGMKLFGWFGGMPAGVPRNGAEPISLDALIGRKRAAPSA